MAKVVHARQVQKAAHQIFGKRLAQQEINLKALRKRITELTERLDTMDQVLEGIHAELQDTGKKLLAESTEE